MCVREGKAMTILVNISSIICCWHVSYLTSQYVLYINIQKNQKISIIFEKWLKDILGQIPEYHELNVSRYLKEKGIKADDIENSGFKFISRYTEETFDDRYTDFIDLDALISNISLDIDWLQQMNKDCFLCKYAKEYGSMEPSDSDKCKKCMCNPDIRYERETHPMALKPKKEWTEEEKIKYNLD